MPEKRIALAGIPMLAAIFIFDQMDFAYAALVTESMAENGGEDGAMPDDNAKPPFTNCPACGTPQIDGLQTLVLYFASVEDCREAAALLKEALPQSFKAYTTEGEIDG